MSNAVETAKSAKLAELRIAIHSRLEILNLNEWIGLAYVYAGLLSDPDVTSNLTEDEISLAPTLAQAKQASISALKSNARYKQSQAAVSAIAASFDAGDIDEVSAVFAISEVEF